MATREGILKLLGEDPAPRKDGNDYSFKSAVNKRVGALQKEHERKQSANSGVKKNTSVPSDFSEQVKRVSEKSPNAQILPRSSVTRVLNKQGTSTAEKALHTAGYIPETIAAGTLGAAEDVGDFGLSVLESLGYGISSLGGLKENAVSDWFKRQFEIQNTKKDISERWRESAERRYSGTPEIIKKGGDTLQSAGAMIPSILTAILTGGASEAGTAASEFSRAARTAETIREGADAFGKAAIPQAIKDTAKRASVGAKEFFNPSSAIFGMGAAGSATEDAYRRSGNIGKSLAYGTMSGIGEMATEKIFGGFAGTDIGDSIIDFNIKNKALRKGVNLATEAIEEQIMTGLDPIMLRASGVDNNAELATLGEYAESGMGGILLSLLMNAATIPIQNAGRHRAINRINNATETLNQYVTNEGNVLKPLTAAATDEEIQQRQEEISYYANALRMKMQKKERRSAAAQAQKSAVGGAAETRGTDNAENVKTGAPNNARTAENTKNTANTARGAELAGNTVRRSAAADRWGKSVGENGQKAYNDNIREDTDLDMYTKGFARYYDLGLSGVPFETVKQEMKGNTFGEYLTPDQSYAAYYSGVNDAKLSLENEKNRVKTVDYFSDDAGIVNNEHLAGLDKDFLKATDRLAKGLGVQVVFSDTLEGGKVNGFIENGKIMLSRDSQMSYASLAGHEITHRMQELAPEEYRAYRDFVMSKVGADAVDAYRTKLLDAGYPMTEEQILDEVAANFTGEKILKDTDSINDFVNEVKEKTGNLNIIQRLHKAICDFIAKVKNIFKGDKSAQDAAAQKAFGTDTATLERARDLLKQAYDKGVKEIESRKGSGKSGHNSNTNTVVRFSVKEDSENNRENTKKVVEILKNSISTINKENVFSITDSVLKENVNASAAVMEYFNRIGNVVTNPVIGDIELNKAGAKATVFHGIGSEKMLAVGAIKEVIEKGSIISKQENWKNRNYDTYVIAAKGTLKDVPSIVGVVIKAYPNEKKMNKFYLHEVIKIGVDSQKNDGIANQSVNSVSKSTPYADSVSQKENNVNTYYTQNDRKKTQEMLNAARLYLPAGLSNPESDTIIRQSKNVVNTHYTQSDKKRTQETLKAARLYLPAELSNPEFDTIIHQSENVVNTNADKNKSQQWAEGKGLQLSRPADPIADTGSVSQKENNVNTHYTQNDKNNVQNTRKFSVKTESENIENGDKITIEDVKAVQSIPRKSVNDFSADDIKKTERFARRYFKEMGTKSPFFRSWFGDWRENDTTKVRVAAEKGSQRGVTKNLDTGWNINVSGKVFNETGHKAIKNQRALQYLDYINSIVENAVLFDSHTIAEEKAKSENSAMMHSLYAVADMGNGRELIKIYVEELNDVNSDGTMKRAYQLQNIENQQLEVRSSGNIRSSIMPTADVNTVSDLFNLVKAFDKNFSPKEASKVVNADGSPRVMYHGTSESFTVFDKKKAKYSGTLGKAFYFTDSDSHAGQYGNLMKAYLDIKNPIQGGRESVSDIRLRRFLEALKENDEDYSIENYGTYDIDEIMESFETDDLFSVLRDINATAIGDFAEAVRLFNEVNETDYDGIITDTETAVFSPNQIKSETDNIGTFDKSNPDIRFSVKGTENVVSDIEELRKYELALAQKYEDLKKQGTKNISKAEFVKAAKNILEELDLAYNKKEFAADLEGLAEDTQAIIKGEMDFDTFRGKVRGMAENIIESGAAHDTQAYADTRELREYLRTTPIKVDRATRANLGDEYESIRKGTFGRLRLNQNDGVDIGTAYRELSVLFPEFFDAEKETNGSAQLRSIADVVEHIKSLNDNPYNGYKAEAAEWLSNMIIDSVYDVGFKSGKYSTKVVADALTLRDNAERAFRDAAESDRRWRDREYDKLRREFEGKDKRRTERREKLIKMKQIRLHTERISKMLLNPSERVAVPEFVKKPVAEVLSCIDLRNDRMGEKTVQRLRELSDTYRMIAEGETDESLVVDPDLEYNIKEIANIVDGLNTKDKRISELPKETLETLRQAVTAIENAMSFYNKTFRNKKGERIDKLAFQINNEMKKRKDFRESKLGAVQAGSDLLHMDMLNPWDFFHMLGPTAESLYGEIREGMNRQTNNINRAVKHLQELKKDCGINEKAVTGKQAKATEYTLSNGQKVSLTKAQVMSLYCLSRQKASHEHMTMGGIRPARVEQSIITDKDGKKRVSTKIDSKEKRVRVTLEDVGNIVGKLSDKEKEFAEGISKYFSTVCAAQGNEVSLQLYGYKKFNAANYFPIKSDDRFIQKEFGAYLNELLVSMGITKKRVLHANNPIIIEDIFDVYARHTSDMANYNAYVLPLQDLQRVFNAKGLEDGVSVREVLEEKFGRRASTYFANLMTDINGGAKYESTAGNKLVNMTISNYKKSVISYNMRVVIQQPMSYIRAGILIDPKYMIKASGRKVDLETVYKYSPIARWKDWGFFSLDTGRDMKEIILDNEKWSQKYTEAGMKLAGKADQVTWKRIWNAVELEVADKNPGLTKGSQEFYTECGKRFDEIIDRTQVVDSTLHRSQILRSKDGLVKTSASFMSEPIKTYNLIHTAAEDYKTNPNEQTRARLARTGVICLISSLSLAVVTGVFDTLKGDDDDEGFYESIYNRLTGKEVSAYENGKQSFKRRFISNAVDNFVGDWTGMIPIVKDVFSIIQGFTPKRTEMQGIGNFVSAIRRASSDNYTAAFKIADLIRYGADFCGKSVTSMKTFVYDILVKNVFKAVDNQWFDYNMTKQMYLVENSRNKGKFTDILFDAWRKGHKEQYDAIVADMIDNGIDAKVINARLKAKYKEFMETDEFRESKGFDVPWDNKAEIPSKERESQPGLESLNSRQYASYESYATRLENDLKGKISSYRDEFSTDDYNSILSAAYDYATETALEKASGGSYDSEKQWINDAQAAEEMGLDPAEYIKYKQEYGARALAIDKLEGILMSGIDVEKYLEFKQFASEAKADRDANGKSISGSKKRKVVDYLNDSGVTDDEWDYFYHDVMGYKK